MNNNEYYEQSFNFLLEQAASIADEAQSAEIDRLYEKCKNEKTLHSNEFNKKMKSILAKNRFKSCMCRLNANSKKIACVFLAVLVGLTVTTFSVRAWRIKLLNFLFDSSKPGTEFTFTDGGAARASVPEFSFDYIPDGFELGETKHSRNAFMTYYLTENEVEWICFRAHTTGGKFDIDTEDAKIEYLEIDGHEAVYITNKNHNAFVWSDDTYAYILGGSISKDELLKMIDGMEIID